MEELNTPIYYGEATVTHVDGGTANINIETSSGTRLLVYSISVKMSNTASGRTVYVRLYNSSNEELNRLAFVGLDNKSVFVPNVGIDGTTNNNLSNMQLIPVCNGDKINISAFTMAAGETYEIFVRGYIKGKIPSMTSTGSTGTVTISNTIQQIK